MLVTVTNLSTTQKLNTPDVYTSTLTGTSADLVATGGVLKNRLPYPFDRVSEVAASGSIQRAMHPADWRHMQVPSKGVEPSREWSQMIQAGKISLTIGAETDRTDPEELFVTAV